MWRTLEFECILFIQVREVSLQFTFLNSRILYKWRIYYTSNLAFVYVTGAISTELNRHLGPVVAVLYGIGKHFIKTPFHGAQTTLYCALETSLENESGHYYSDCRKQRPSRNALNEEDQKKLWDLSEEIVGLKVPLN